MADAPVTAPSPPAADEESSPPPPSDSWDSPPSDSSSPSSSPPPSSPESPPPFSPPPSSPPPNDDDDGGESSPPPSDSEKSKPPRSQDSPPSRGPPADSQTQPAPSAFIPPSPGAVSNQTPPTPAGRLNPPSGHRTPGSSKGSSSNSDSSGTAVIVAGIAVAGFLLLALIICCMCNKKKKKPYYMDPARVPPPGAGGGGGGNYYNNSPWATQDHVVKLPPPQGLMGTPIGPGGGGGGWGPPPPLMNTSGDFSGVGPSGPSPPHMSLGFSKSQFTYEELATATGGFAQSNLLGQGGFGYVHKGVLPHGQEVAVKSLKSGSGQGEREFQAEVEIISRVHHRHLVSLVGYCIADAQRMLVYEFVPNKTLEHHLHGKGQPVMDWETRMRIALGSAKGLAYLHEDCHPRIIHRDIKAANILIDSNYEAMVADFGLAKLSSGNDTHVSTRVMGTFGYLAPEYASSGKLTEKSDVFSFGVMLLEILTGRKPVDPTSKYMEDSLVDWARPLLTKALEDGNYSELVDPRLEGNYEPHEIPRMVSCAAASIRHSAKRRPRMSQIVRALEGDASLESLDDTKPARAGSTISTSNQTSDLSSSSMYDTRAYNDDMMKFRKMVMSSQEFPSSEYGATSEYGLNPSSSSSEVGNSGPQRQKP